MTDAHPSAADGQTVPYPGHPSTLVVMLHSGHNGFIALARKTGPDGSIFAQRCYRLQQAMQHLPGRESVDEYYFSPNQFRRLRRLTEDLATASGTGLGRFWS